MQAVTPSSLMVRSTASAQNGLTTMVSCFMGVAMTGEPQSGRCHAPQSWKLYSDGYEKERGPQLAGVMGLDFALDKRLVTSTHQSLCRWAVRDAAGRRCP